MDSLIEFDNLIKKINNNELNINDLDHETRINLMKYSYQIATNQRQNIIDIEYEENYCKS